MSAKHNNSGCKIECMKHFQNVIVICLTIDFNLKIDFEDLSRGIEPQKQRRLPYVSWWVHFLEGAYEYYSLEEDVADGSWAGCVYKVRDSTWRQLFCFIWNSMQTSARDCVTVAAQPDQVDVFHKTMH